MIPATGVAVASPAPAPSTAPAEPAASADFMALLLLLMGVGSGTPQPEGQAAGERSHESAEGAATLSVPEPAGTPVVTAVATPTAMVTPMVTAPTQLGAVEIAMAPSPRRVDVEAGPGATTVPAPLPRTEVASGAQAAISPRPRPTHEIDAAPVAIEAPTPATPGAQPADVPAAAVQSAREAREGAPVWSAEHALRELGLVEEASAPPAMAAAHTPAATGAPAIAAAGLGEGAMDHRGPDAGEGGERSSHGPGDSLMTATPAPVLHGAAGATALRESHRAEAPAASAPVVEPRVVAEQIVQAARVVVNGDEAEMHVQLDPPALGGVHVTAGARGAAVEITISADRPETQALLTRALPEIQQTLAERGLGSASISVVTTPMADDGRRTPDRRPPEPRERPTTPHSNDRRRTPSASRRVSAVDITV